MWQHVTIPVNGQAKSCSSIEKKEISLENGGGWAENVGKDNSAFTVIPRKALLWGLNAIKMG